MLTIREILVGLTIFGLGALIVFIAKFVYNVYSKDQVNNLIAKEIKIVTDLIDAKLTVISATSTDSLNQSRKNDDAITGVIWSVKEVDKRVGELVIKLDHSISDVKEVKDEGKEIKKEIKQVLDKIQEVKNEVMKTQGEK